MAQKKAVAKPKKGTNGVQAKQGNQVQKNALKNKLAESAALAAAVVVKPQQKKGAGKVPVKAVPPPKPVVEEESDVDDDDDEEDDEEIQEQGNGKQLEEDESDEVDEDAEDDDEDEEEEDSEDLTDEEDDSISDAELGEIKLDAGQVADNNDDDDDDDDDDYEPEEAPIKKQDTVDESNVKIKVKVGSPPEDTPDDHIICVSNLPQKYNRLELLTLFMKFGQISVSSFVKGQRFSILLVYDNAESAKAAVVAKGLTLQGQELTVALGPPEVAPNNSRERSVRVSCLSPDTTEIELKELFAKCGAIEEVRQWRVGIASVLFQSTDSVAAAVKLTNSKVGDRVVQVTRCDVEIEKDEHHTVVVSNTAGLESCSSEVLAKIFNKVGEIKSIDVLCTKTILAFVTFNTEDAVEKALEWDGKTVEDLALKLERYKSTNSRSHGTIIVTNLAYETEKEDLEVVFSKAGEIENMNISSGRAFITFKTTQGFCNSFAYNETVIKGKHIFLVPYSKLRNKFMGSYPGNKRPFGNGPPQQRNFNGPQQRNFGGPQRNFNGPKGNFNNKRPAPGQKRNAPFNNKRPKPSTN